MALAGVKNGTCWCQKWHYLVSKMAPHFRSFNHLWITLIFRNGSEKMKSTIKKILISFIIVFAFINILDILGQYNYISFISGAIAANIYIYFYDRIEDE